MNLKRGVLKLACVLLPVLCVLLAACSDSDDSRLPDLVKEFFSVRTNADGSVSAVCLDSGSTFTGVIDRTASRLAPDTTLRMVGYYQSSDDGQAEIYSMRMPNVSKLKPLAELGDKFPSHPAQLQSIWVSGCYLNIVLNIRNAGGRHALELVDAGVENQSAGQRRPTLHVRLLHDEGDDQRAYTSDAYCSVSLQPYLALSPDGLSIDFSLTGYDGQEHHYMVNYEPKNP